ncbi:MULTISPECIES: autotransporter outer membrane beta-barrel domain-containing protein [Asticcacaulis]|uniref:autotransporter outer membrane beta-barrel domain-containing protein n=1 Tax=Asticcacaulis TaxID=76890 RepID=UPI001AEBA5E3|nr:MULTISPECIES: autotransporter outer membrane beta-barrel domain-containing protein [Asticcacaulis]MBP2158229.1 hypothetical protein [Asticcacaulis solisilvae]MDR6799274.1 hypothetical protein [Asticcacaulis sp. BE141]
MRKHQLLSATALGLILTGLVAGQALAATTISTATTAPVNTTTTGDLTVDSNGKITLTSGTAITVNSNNTVSLTGAIDMAKSADNSTAVLIDGGRTSTLTIGGAITVTDDYTATDSKNTGDGVLDGPFAQGTGRYGVRSTGTTPFVGNVTVSSAAAIKVEGNNSYGVRFENKIDGAFKTDGTIAMEGDNNTAIALENGATGNVILSGTIGVHGKDSSVAVLNGDFGGSVIIDGGYSSSGYATATPSTLTADQLKAVMATPEDMYQSGATVSLSGNYTKGVLIGAAQANNVDTDTSSADSNPDEDGDGQVDSDQGTANITNYGSAPALRIGSATTATTLGGVTYASTAVSPPAVNYGLLIRGGITGAGVYTGINGTAVQLGGLGQAVTIANGIGVYNTTGVISATSGGGNATGLLVGAGLSTPRLDINKGTIRATIATVTTGTTTNGTTTYTTVGAGTTARAIDIAAGANLAVIDIAAGSSVQATATGSTANAAAIRDQSNTLTTLNNKNIIAATITASDDNGDGVADTLVNRPVAIDTRTNTVGLTLTQTDTAPTDSDADKAIAAPFIVGDILLGSGGDAIAQNGGTISGNIDFGAGANSYILTGASTYFGKLSSTGTVALDIGGTSAAALTAGTRLNLTTLHVGDKATLGITLDTTAPTTPVFAATGTAVFDNGATLNIALNNVLLTPQSFTVMTASNINLGNMATTLDGRTPYVYHADLTTDAAKTTLSANFRLKTQAEAGFTDNEYAAFLPVMNAVKQDAAATAAIMSTLTKDAFDPIYNQYLPDYSGETAITLAQGHESLTQGLGSLTVIPNNDGGQYWLQEYGFRNERERGDTAGFEATGFSFAGGRETAMGDKSMVGVYLAYTSTTPIDSFAIGNEDLVASDLTIGGYWRMRSGGFKGWAHVGAGFAQFESTRELLSKQVAHVAESEWNGYSYSAGIGASVDYRAGFFNVTPALTADFFGLNEEERSETGGGDYFNLDVASRDSKIASAKALVNVSYTRWFIRPELWIGWKQSVAGDLGDTVANFKGGTAFTLNGGEITGGGPVAGFRLSTDNEYSYFSLEGNYQDLEAYKNYSLSLRTRFQF